MNSNQTKRCVACAEEIQAAALLCRHCSTDQRDLRFLTESTEEPSQSLTGRDAAFDFVEAKKISSEHESQEASSLSETENQKKDQSRKKLLFWGSAAVLGIVLLMFVESAPQPSRNQIDPNRKVSYEFGVEVGKALRASNTLLFPDRERDCANAYSYYSLQRDLIFDRFLEGCKWGYRN